MYGNSINLKNREEGNYREDHRHHIVDAFVAGLNVEKIESVS